MQTLDFVSGLHTVSNSPNPSPVYIRLCKHRKRFLMLKKSLEIVEVILSVLNCLAKFKAYNSKYEQLTKITLSCPVGIFKIF